MSNHTQKVKEGLNDIADDSKALLAATAEATEETVVEARNRLASALDSAKETFARVQKKAVAGAKTTDKMIRENPYQAIGIALGVGALIGYLLSRRRRD